LQNINLTGYQKHENINKTRNDLAMEDSSLASLAKILPVSNTQMVLKWLSLNLNTGEQCVTFVSGSKNYASPSWLILTNMRLIFTADKLAKSFDSSKNHLQFDLKNVNDARFQKKTFFTLGELQITTNSGTIVLDNVIPDSGKDFIASLLTTRNFRN